MREFRESLVDAEGIAIGDTVMARFTANGRYHRYRGKVVGRTLNYWKIEALEPVYGGDVGRVFQIQTKASPTWSEHNSAAPLNPDGSLAPSPYFL